MVTYLSDQTALEWMDGELKVSAMPNIDPQVIASYEGPEGGYVMSWERGLLEVSGHPLFTNQYGSISLF